MRANWRGEINDGGDALKRLAAGLVGGLVASAAMNQFQAQWSRLTKGEERPHGAQSMQQGLRHVGVSRELQVQDKDDQEDDAAMRLANAVSAGVFDRELTRNEKDFAGTARH